MPAGPRVAQRGTARKDFEPAKLTSLQRRAALIWIRAAIRPRHGKRDSVIPLPVRAVAAAPIHDLPGGDLGAAGGEPTDLLFQAPSLRVGLRAVPFRLHDDIARLLVGQVLVLLMKVFVLPPNAQCAAAREGLGEHRVVNAGTCVQLIGFTFNETLSSEKSP